MDQDSAILAAAFALRDREGPVSPVADKLRTLLPKSANDVDAGRRAALGDAAIAVIAEDPAELAWFRGAVANFKSFGGAVGGAISELPLSEVYACPQGDYRWTRPDVQYDVPLCPTHRIALTLA